MADENPAAEALKPKTDREKLDEAYQAYFKAVKSGDKALAAKIHAENKLVIHPAHHS